MKYLLICFLSFFILSHSIAQSFNWLQTGGSINVDKAYGVTSDSVGNSYVTGQFQNSMTIGSTTLTSAGQSDIFIIKYDGSGSIVWAKRFGGSLDDIGNDIIVDKSGNLYLTGYFQDSVNFDLVNVKSKGFRDSYLAKLSNTGSVIWVKTASGKYNDYGKNLSIDQNGNIYMLGAFVSDTLRIDTFEIYLNGNDNLFLAKYNTSGSMLWVKQVINSTEFSNACIANDKLGNLYFAGPFLDTTTIGNIGLSSLGAADIFLAKLDTNGNVIWVKKEGGNRGDFLADLTIDNQNNPIIAGYFFDSTIIAGNTYYTIANYEYYLAKYNPSGIIQFVSKSTSQYEAVPSGVATDVLGNIYLTGYFRNPLTVGGINLTPTGKSDIFLFKYAPNGTATWGIKAGGTNFDESTNLSIMKSKLLITGFFFDFTSFGTLQGFGFGTYDFLVAGMQIDISTQLPNVSNQRSLIFDFYPNPSHKMITLQTPNEAFITNITISDLTGKIIYYKPQTESLQITLPEVRKGLYILQVDVNGEKQSRKIYIE